MLRMVADNVALVEALARDAGRHRRPRLGRADRLELGAAAARHVPRPWPGCRCRTHRRASPDRRTPSGRWAGTRSSTSSTSSSPGAPRPRSRPTCARWLLGFYFTASGDAARPEGGRTMATIAPGGQLLDRFRYPDVMPAWLTDEDLDFYAGEFERTGFTGGLNRYRNIDRDFEDALGLPAPPDRGPGAVHRRRPRRADDLGSAGHRPVPHDAAAAAPLGDPRGLRALDATGAAAGGQRRAARVPGLDLSEPRSASERGGSSLRHHAGAGARMRDAVSVHPAGRGLARRRRLVHGRPHLPERGGVRARRPTSWATTATRRCSTS